MNTIPGTSGLYSWLPLSESVEHFRESHHFISLTSFPPGRAGLLLLLLSRFSRVRLCATPQMAAHQAPPPWDSLGKNTGVGGHFLLQCMQLKRESEVTQSSPTLHDPKDCSLPGSSVHGIFQARVLEWDAIVFSRASWADEAKSSQTALEFFHSKLWQSGSLCMAQVEISF